MWAIALIEEKERIVVAEDNTDYKSIKHKYTRSDIADEPVKIIEETVAGDCAARANTPMPSSRLRGFPVGCCWCVCVGIDGSIAGLRGISTACGGGIG